MNTSAVLGGLLRTRLLIISFVPLFAMFAAASAPTQVWPLSAWTNSRPFLVWIGLLVLSVLVTATTLAACRRRGAREVEVSDLHDQGAAAAGYLVTYLLPLLTTSPKGWNEAFVLAMYLATAAIIFVRSDIGLLNPTLYLFGWRVASGTLTRRADGRPVTHEIFLIYKAKHGSPSQLLAAGDHTLPLSELTGLFVYRPEVRSRLVPTGGHR